MKNNIRILASRRLKAPLENVVGNGKVELLYFSDGDTNLVEKIACTQPDAVIMNLFMPEQDAVEVIRAYKTLYSDSFTYFAVLCPICTEGLRYELDKCGVNRMIRYPYQPRDFESMLVEICRLKGTPLAVKRSAGIHAVHRIHEGSGTDAVAEPLKAVDAILSGLGMRRGTKGYQYLTRAVVLAVEKGDGPVSVTKDIYPAVAEEYGTTPSCVERNIRVAITEAWKASNGGLLSAYFGNTVDNMRGRPSNSEFIAMLADRICLDHSKRSETVPV